MRHRIEWWLDFESLRSAMLNHENLMPWDYQIEISILEKRFRKYYRLIMEELHQCEDPDSPLYYKRYSSKEENLRGKFQTKSEPRFWVEINPWYVDEHNMLQKAGWGHNEKENRPVYKSAPYDYIRPLHTIELNGFRCKVPAKSKEMLAFRFGEDFKDVTQPSYYRPDLKWGSREMKKIR